MKTFFKLHKILFLCLALIFCAGQLRAARAAPQGVIQDMINAAADGASLDIPAGTYTENLIINSKNITLRGANRDTTIIQAANSDRVIYANSNKGLRLENLTIKNGNATGNSGGGVYAGGGTLQIVNCHITNNTANYGGGVFLGDWQNNVPPSNLVLSGSILDDNTASNTGGGVYAAGSATLYNTTLEANSAGNHGGGIHVAGSATLTGGAVTGNHALNGNGGGVNVNNGLTVSGTIFTSNTAGGYSDISGSGGAVSQWNTGNTVTITGAIFNSNTAQYRGGAVFIRQNFLTLDTSMFTSNTVDSGASTEDTYGGGMYAGGGLDGTSLTFTTNSAKCTGSCYSFGGGLYINRPENGPSAVSASAFDGNLAWMGSGIFAESSVQLTLTQVDFTNNGAVIYGQPTSGYGGGVEAYWVHGDRLLFQNNKVINYGGGVSAAECELAHTRFIGNISNVGGGAVDINSNLHGSNLLFTGNSGPNGAAVHLKANATATIYNATIAQPAQGAGPAVYLEANTTLNLYNSIVNNYTNAISLNSATLNEDYNLFYNNTVDLLVSGTYTVNSGGHSTGLTPPGFANPAAGNYHLRSTSYAIAHGHNYGLADDLDGRPRLSGRNDVGAYQFWTSTYLPLIRR